MTLTKDQQEQLENALSELGDVRKYIAALVSLRREDRLLLAGGIDLAEGWIKRVLQGIPLSRLPKRHRRWRG